MKNWKNTSSMVLYIAALAISTIGTMWIIDMHMELWRQGKFILVAFAGLAVIEYIVVSLIPWALARWLQKRRKWDIAFAVATAIPFILLTVLRSQDWIG